MTAKKLLIEELKKYFNIKELVCPHVYEKFGERAWIFLDTMALCLLLVLHRDILKVPLVCNTKTLTQRGLRCNLCDIIKKKTADGKAYLSPHSLGKAWDLSSPAMSAEEMRLKIAENVDLLPCKVRIEQDVTWLHIDTYDEMQTAKIKYFKA